MFSIADALENVTQSIKKAEIKAGRPENSVKLLAVSKKQSEDRLVEAFNLGLRSFGENYASEAFDKQLALEKLLGERYSELEWHFIGPIQSNKTRKISESFSWVQSVDRDKIAQRLSDQRPKELGPLNVCIQVNVDAEETKSGVLPEQVLPFATSILSLEGLNLRGLMCIPKAQQSSEELGASFTRMKHLFEQVKMLAPQVDTLSMGMSADIEAAIENGSTMVRVGTALFGKR